MLHQEAIVHDSYGYGSALNVKCTFHVAVLLEFDILGHQVGFRGQLKESAGSYRRGFQIPTVASVHPVLTNPV